MTPVSCLTIYTDIGGWLKNGWDNTANKLGELPPFWTLQLCSQRFSTATMAFYCHGMNTAKCIKAEPDVKNAAIYFDFAVKLCWFNYCLIVLLLLLDLTHKWITLSDIPSPTHIYAYTHLNAWGSHSLDPMVHTADHITNCQVPASVCVYFHVCVEAKIHVSISGSLITMRTPRAKCILSVMYGLVLHTGSIQRQHRNLWHHHSSFTAVNKLDTGNSVTLFAHSAALYWPEKLWYSSDYWLNTHRHTHAN